MASPGKALLLSEQSCSLNSQDNLPHTGDAPGCFLPDSVGKGPWRVGRQVAVALISSSMWPQGQSISEVKFN